MKKLNELRPFFSVLIIIMTLFFTVFLHMEERRMGYSVLKLNREIKKLNDEKRTLAVRLAKVTRPQRVESMAQNRGHLRRAEEGQIIHLSGRAVASDIEVRP